MNNILDHIDFKNLKPLLDDEDITDINCRNNSEVWVTSNSKGHHLVNIRITKEDIMNIAYQVANRMEKEFNPNNPCLEGDIEDQNVDIRVSAIHSSLSVNGTSLALRKVSKKLILNDEYLISSNYITKEALEFLKRAVKDGNNIIILGETGTGKTELLKYLATFIPKNQLIATIEDSLEFNIKKIKPDLSCSAFRVKNDFSYADIIKMSLRQNINWILLQEARGSEVNDLLEAMSTGHSVMTTMHARSCESVAIRIKQMLHDSNEGLDSIRMRLYSLVDLVVLLKKDSDGKVYRYVDEIALYEYDYQKNQCLTHSVYKKGLAMNLNKNGDLKW